MPDYGRDVDIGKPTDGLLLTKIAIAAQILVDESITDEDLGAVDSEDNSGR